jgi:hypothetical protein
MANLPVIPVLNGSPVALVKTPDAGVPKAGEVNVGDVNVLFVNVSVPAKVANVPVTAGNVMVAEPETAGATIAAEPVLGDAPAKVTLVPLASPMVGDTKVGEVLNTTEPVPVSFVIALAKLMLVGVVKNVPIFPPKSLMSVVCTLAQAGTAEVVPFPVCVKNCLVAEVDPVKSAVVFAVDW